MPVATRCMPPGMDRIHIMAGVDALDHEVRHRLRAGIDDDRHIDARCVARLILAVSSGALSLTQAISPTLPVRCMRWERRNFSLPL